MSRRRRVLAFAAALGAATLVAAGVVIVLVDDADTPTVDARAGTKEVTRVGDLESVDAFVLLAPPGDDAELARLRGALDGSEIVDEYVYLPYGWWTFLQVTSGGAGAIPAGALEECPEIVAPAVLVEVGDGDVDQGTLDSLLAPARRVTGSVFPRLQVGGGLPEIFMDIDATAAQVAAIAARLEADPDVAGVEHLTKAGAHEEFLRIFSDQPDLVENIDPNDLPESFRIEAADDASVEALVQRYSGASGVDEVVAREWDGDFDVTRAPEVLGDVDDGVQLEIFMDIDASPDEIGAVLEQLAAESRVVGYEHITRDEAYEEFVRIFGDAPRIVENVDRNLLPESIRVEAGHDDVPALVSTYSDRLGVDEVVTAPPAGALESFCPAELRDP